MEQWTVELAISGPIGLSSSTLRLQTLKGDILPFQTNLTLKNKPHGVHITVVVRSDTSEGANDAAVYFVGRAIDVLCLEIDAPLHVSVSGPQFRQSDTHIKRLIDQDNWFSSFERGRQYGVERSTFSRALSWFRKGHTSEDPIDKFLAFWASIEAVGSKYARQNERTQLGVKNKICDCFDQLWGSVNSWKIIPNNAAWVDQFCERRNQITHGTIALVEMASIREIANSIPTLHGLAREFLREWQDSPTIQEFAEQQD